VTGSESDGMPEKEIEAAHFSETSVNINHVSQETAYFIVAAMRTSNLTWYI
jgi:hypothetical protein